jgi:DNA-binding SARP family transcriptional activator/predicted ATPase
MVKSIADFNMKCFGGFHLEVNGNPIYNFKTNKARALLVYLAVETPRRFRRSHLAGMLWSEFREDQALHSLRQTLVWLKKAMAEVNNHTPILITSQDTIGINPEININVDLLDFENYLKNALQYYRQDKHLDHVDILGLKKAIDLFKGSFLERFAMDESPLFDEWALTIRENTDQKATELLALLCEYHERRKEYDLASEYADRIIALTPWDEPAYVHSMRLNAMRKHWSTAKKRYFQLKDYLENNFSIEPIKSVADLYEEIRHLSIDDRILLPQILPAGSYLPTISSPFIGRKEEIEDIVNMLSNPKIRMITLVGIGGIGKSRLAIEIGIHLYGLYVNGNFFVPLRETSGVEGIIHQIAECMDFSFSGTTSPQSQLLNYLREKRCLLILDCFEHLLEYEENLKLLPIILKQAPGVKFLITSREPLRLAEEHIYPVRGLGCDSENERISQGQLQSDAITLFENKAKQVNHHFTFDITNRKIAEKICRFVEGHPLSIELLASNTRTHNLNDLFSEIERGLLSIKSSISNGLPDQKNLGAVLERSWDLLNQSHQRSLARLACFQGGFSLDAAIEVGETSKEILITLIDKSLVKSGPNERLALHELIRQFSCKKAIEIDLYQPAIQSHAEYYLSLIENLVQKDKGIHAEKLLETMDNEQINIINAWEYFINNRITKKLSRMVEPLFIFFITQSRFQEGMLLFQNAIISIDDADLNQVDELAGKLKLRIGFFAHRLRQNSLAFKMFSDGKEIFSKIHNLREIGLALLGFGNYYLRHKKFDLAMENTEKSLEYFNKIDDISNQARAYELLGLIHNRRADFITAKEMLAHSIKLSREINDRRGLISSLNQLGDLACNEGDFRAAETLFLESLSYSRAYKDRYNQAILLNNLASVYRPLNDYDHEREVLLESLAICREIGDQDGEAIALNNLGDLSVVLGEFEQAIQYCQISLQIAQVIGEDWTVIINYDILGEAYLGLNEPEKAMMNFRSAIKIAYNIQSWDLLTRAVVNAAGVYRIQKDLATSKKFLEAALAHPGILFEYKQKALRCLVEMGFSDPGQPNPEIIENLLENYFNLT